MPIKRRRHIPKTKGCHECSQRRISCDRNKPSCKKCISKGIPCTGVDLRVKFHNVKPNKNQKSERDRICFKRDRRPIEERSCRGDHVLNHQQDHENMETINLEDAIFTGTACDYPTRTPTLDTIHHPPTIRLLSSHFKPTPYAPLEPNNLTPQTLALLTHFSTHIAPEMVPLDDPLHNGWRASLLPQAHITPLLLHTTLCVSTSHILHLQPHLTPYLPNPNVLFGKAIRDLRLRGDLRQCSKADREVVVMAILVLLLGATVNEGWDFFPGLWVLLGFAVSPGEGKGEVGGFWGRQVGKMQAYAGTLLSRADGVRNILAYEGSSLECLKYYAGIYPGHAETLGVLMDLRQQAYLIYLHRVGAVAGDAGASSIERVEMFKRTFEGLGSDGIGRHVLIWSSFIAAADSVDEVHREFFKRYLESEYRRSGFSSIKRALGLLERIWGLENQDDWPDLLPEPGAFIM